MRGSSTRYRLDRSRQGERRMAIARAVDAPPFGALVVGLIAAVVIIAGSLGPRGSSP